MSLGGVRPGRHEGAHIAANVADLVVSGHRWRRGPNRRGYHARLAEQGGELCQASPVLLLAFIFCLLLQND